MADSRNWYDLNASRRYPLDDAATGEGTGGELPGQFFADAQILFPDSLGTQVRLATARFSAGLATATFISDTGVPLAAVSVPRRQLVYGRIYPLDPLADLVGGFVVFGGPCDEFDIIFPTMAASRIAAGAARPYRDPAIPGFGRHLADPLTGIVELRGDGDVTVAVTDRDVAGVLRQVIAIGLGPGSGGQNPLEVYRGRCTGRPESKTCNPAAIEKVGGVTPDANGVIRIKLMPAEQFRVTEAADHPEIAVVESALAFNAYCGVRATERVAVDTDTPDPCPASPPGPAPTLPFATTFVTEEETYLRAARGGIVHGGSTGTLPQPGENVALWCPPNAAEILPRPAAGTRLVEMAFVIDQPDVPATGQEGGVVFGWRPNSVGQQYFRAMFNPADGLFELDFWTGRQYQTLVSQAVAFNAALIPGEWHVAVAIGSGIEPYRVTAELRPGSSTAPVLSTINYDSPGIRPARGDRYGVSGTQFLSLTRFAFSGDYE